MLIRSLATAIRDTTLWSKVRDLNGLPGFLEMVSGNSTKLWSASKKNGSPHTIVVAGSGLRAADIARYFMRNLPILSFTDSDCRTVRKCQTKDVKVAKLFAKHIKIQESINLLKSNRVGIAVGTPTRLQDLTDEG